MAEKPAKNTEKTAKTVEETTTKKAETTAKKAETPVKKVETTAKKATASASKPTAKKITSQAKKPQTNAKKVVDEDEDDDLLEEVESTSKKATTSSSKQGKSAKSKKKKTNIFVRMGQGIVRFFRDTKGEMKRIVWPSAKQVRSNLLIVMVFCIFMALLIFALDLGFAQIMKWTVELGNFIKEEQAAGSSSSASLPTSVTAVIRPFVLYL